MFSRGLLLGCLWHQNCSCDFFFFFSFKSLSPFIIMRETKADLGGYRQPASSTTHELEVPLSETLGPQVVAAFVADPSSSHYRQLLKSMWKSHRVTSQTQAWGTGEKGNWKKSRRDQLHFSLHFSTHLRSTLIVPLHHAEAGLTVKAPKGREFCNHHHHSSFLSSMISTE